MAAANAAGSETGKWSDFNRELGRVRVFAPDTSWIHVVLAEKKDSLNRFLRLSKYRQGFNINSAEDLASITLGLQEAAEVIGWTTGFDTFLKSVGKTKYRSEEDEETIKHLRSRVRKFVQDNLTLKQEVLRSQLPILKEELTDFKKQLAAKLTETKMHNWLKDHIWVFGTDYINQQPKSFSEVGWVRSRFDFFLQRVDSFYDIVELKSPTAKLFLKKKQLSIGIFPSRESPISSELQNSISQMIGYLERATVYQYPLLKERGIFVHKPKGLIVIGRTMKDEKEAIKTLNSYLHQIEVLTYDDLYARAKEFVNIIVTKTRSPPSQAAVIRTKIPAKYKVKKV